MRLLKDFLLATATVCGCMAAVGFLLSSTATGARLEFVQSAQELLGIAILAGLVWLALSLLWHND